MRVLAETVARVGEAHRGGERGARVPGAEGIVRPLLAGEETAQTAGLADTVEGWAVAAGEQLVHVALVGHVEDEAVAGRVEDAMQGDGQLNHAEVRSDVASVAGRDRDEALPDLGGELRQAFGRQGADVVRAADGIEQRHVAQAWLSSPDDNSSMRSSAARSCSSQALSSFMPSS